MTTRTPRPHGQAAELSAWSHGRRAYLDNLKVLLIAGIIAIHAILGYTSVEVWTYTQYREVTLSTPVETTMLVLGAPFGFFLIALLFLVAGLLTPGSLARKGSRRFVVDRLLRLGVPFVVYVFVIQPVLKYLLLLRPLSDHEGSFWFEYLGSSGRIDTGPLWFVGVLLVFSIGYAGWVRLRPPPPAPRPVSLRTLLVVAAAVAPASFLVRLVWPYGSEAGFTDLNFWEWPACVAMFAIGIAGSRLGWVEQLPRPLARQCGWLTVVAVVMTTALLAVWGATDRVEDAGGGWSWPAASFALVDAGLTVFGSVWLLGVAQRRMEFRRRWTPVLSRTAYGAFMLQTIFLLALAVALRPVDVPAEVKALVVAVAGVVCSYAAAWLLIRHVPGLHRVL